jgi:hypothetical protein
MDKTLYELKFELRYATRVLERQAGFWRKLDISIKMMSLLSGSAAFAALTNGHSQLTLVLGIVFAVTQALEFSIQPGNKAGEAKSSMRLYSEVSADADACATASTLHAALQKARAQNPVTVFDSIDRLAYADVACEIGRPECAEAPCMWINTMRLMA